MSIDQGLHPAHLRNLGDLKGLSRGIRAHPRTAENSRLVRNRTRRVTSGLKHMPDSLQKQTLLRIDRFSFLSRIGKQFGIEIFCPLQRCSHGHKIRRTPDRSSCVSLRDAVFPSIMLDQNVATSGAFGKRPVMPMTAIGSH